MTEPPAEPDPPPAPEGGSSPASEPASELHAAVVPARSPVAIPSPLETSGPIPETPDEAAAWIRAEAHALAAAALLDDPSVPPWTAAEHLRRGFSALARAAGVTRPEPAAALDPSTLPWLGSPQAVIEPLRRLGTDDDSTLPDPMLRRLSAALSAAVATAADTRFAPTRRVARRRRLVRNGLVTVLVLGLVAAALVLTTPDYREGPWRAAYYPTADFQGEPLVRREGDVKFDWRRVGPPDLPDDHFSIRFDTCLDLPEPREVTFQLVSDDGSRLFIDGTLVLDNWGIHDKRSRGAEIPLTAGPHHLRIDYFDDRRTASIDLRASIWGELPTALPTRLLHHPDDADSPCTTLPRE
jgi:hypothetical protein